MKNFKAVEFMRKVRDQLDQKYARLTIGERLDKTHEEVQKSKLWKKLSKKHRIVSV